MAENENKDYQAEGFGGEAPSAEPDANRGQNRNGRRRYYGRNRYNRRRGPKNPNRNGAEPEEDAQNPDALTEDAENAEDMPEDAENARDSANPGVSANPGDSMNFGDSENTGDSVNLGDTAEEAAAETAEPVDLEPAEENAEPAAPAKSPVEIVGIRFKEAGKVYYFDPAGETYRENDEVIVETARGMEYGFIVTPNCTVYACDIVSPLKQVLRRATEEDHLHYEENNRRRDEAFVICRQKIEEHKIEMKLVDVEYTFDNNKLLFYFTADGRVDFRELVKDLASVFRTRIELRQIGIRDEAKLVGGLGVCGRPFCCHSFLPDFVQVSIKMAKEQNISLNSAKISGTCGRLMCCLRYEYDVYEEEIRKTPKLDTVVSTPDGDGVVTEVIPLAGMIRVKPIGRADAAPKLWHRDNVQVKGKMNWKTGTITPYAQANNTVPQQTEEKDEKPETADEAEQTEN